MLRVLNMSLTASIVIVFVLLARLLLRKAPKVFSYALWAVVLFRLLCPVSISSDFSLLGILNRTAVPATQHTTTVEYIPQDAVVVPMQNITFPAPNIDRTVKAQTAQIPTTIAPTVSGSGAAEQAAPTPAEPTYSAADIVRMVWLSGIAVMILYSAVSFLRLRCKLVGAVRVRNNIYLADYLDMPFVTGLLRARIYLPSSLSEGERWYILLHEQQHIRRLDHIVKLLAFLALCIHWFNPLVWVAFVLSTRDMEMSCDEAVMRKMGEDIRAEYSASLLSLATGRRIIAGTALAFGGGDTKSRIKNVLNWKKPKAWVLSTGSALCIAVVLFCAGNPARADDVRETMVHLINAIHGNAVQSVDIADSDQTQKEAGPNDPNDAAEKPDTPLTEEELACFQDMFTGSGDTERTFTQMLLSCRYNSPEEIDLGRIFSEGVPNELGGWGYEISEAEEAALRRAMGSADYKASLNYDRYKIPASVLEKLLMQYLGIELADMNRRGIEKLTYLEEYDAYYGFPCTLGGVIPVFNSGTRRADGTIELYYHEKHPLGLVLSPTHVLILRPAGESYHFAANIQTVPLPSDEPFYVVARDAGAFWNTLEAAGLSEDEINRVGLTIWAFLSTHGAALTDTTAVLPSYELVAEDILAEAKEAGARMRRYAMAEGHYIHCCLSRYEILDVRQDVGALTMTIGEYIGLEYNRSCIRTALLANAETAVKHELVFTKSENGEFLITGRTNNWIYEYYNLTNSLSKRGRLAR